MKKPRLIRNLIYWLKYRKARKEQAKRAASLAVQLVMNGCLAPPRFTGIGSTPLTGRYLSEVEPIPPHKVFIRREGWA